MRPDPIVEFCLGLGALAIALTVALLLAFPPAWLDHRQAASTYFTDTTGLSEGANVTENGVVEGNVVSIKNSGNRVLVQMKLRADWHLKPGLGLAIEQNNPLQAGSLVAAAICKLTPGADLPAGCCPDKLTIGAPTDGETPLASCGRVPTLIDKARGIASEATAITELAKVQLTSLKKLGDSVPETVKTTMGAVASLKSVTDKVGGVLDDNRGSLKSTLDNVNGVTGNVKVLLDSKQKQLDASIDNLSNVLSTTAAAMPKIVADLDKTAEDMRVITGQVRNEPTAVIRVRERADPSFVEPAAGK